jgi:hypothetical protein
MDRRLWGEDSGVEERRIGDFGPSEGATATFIMGV